MENIWFYIGGVASGAIILGFGIIVGFAIAQMKKDM